MRSNTARRIVPLWDAVRKRAAASKKPAPSFPTADQIDQVREQLWTLVRAGDPKQVDGQLEELLLTLGLDPESPTAWRDGFLLLAYLHYDLGKPPRTNKNATKMFADDDMILLREVIRLIGHGLSQEQAIAKLASDQDKAHVFKFKPTSSNAQRTDALRKRLNKIAKATSGFEGVFGKPPESTVEEALLNMALAEFRKNKPAF
jgi:DNA-binding transcriptional MerR regulator